MTTNEDRSGAARFAAGATVRVAPRACAVEARIVTVEHPCREHVIVTAAVTALPPSFPGQFLQLLCSSEPDVTAAVQDWPPGTFPQLAGEELRSDLPYLRRPFSIADRWEAGGLTHLQVISRAIGPGTRWLDARRPGDVLNLTGPLGRGFRLPEDQARPLLLLGGGVGIPPLLYLARILGERGYRDVTAVFGVQQSDLLPVALLEEPRRDGRPVRCLRLPGPGGYAGVVATDDGSLGVPGRVTDALRKLYDQRGGALRGAWVYACGPERMLAAVSHQARASGLECQLCIERNMGCGLGTCLSCVVRLRSAEHPAGWRWGLACTDGPVFAADELYEAATNEA